MTVEFAPWPGVVYACHRRMGFFRSRGFTTRSRLIWSRLLAGLCMVISRPASAETGALGFIPVTKPSGVTSAHAGAVAGVVELAALTSVPASVLESDR